MVDAVKTIQGAFSTPLQIDSSEAPVIEKALRYYNGKALINSVNGRKDVMDKIFPLEEALVPTLIELIVNEIKKATYSPEDPANNAEDDMADMISFIRRNMKSNLQKQIES